MGVSVNVQHLAEWVPIQIHWERDQPRIDWCWVGKRRFTEPFFDQTIDICMRLPFTNLIRPQTTIDALLDRHEFKPGLQPRGFIFHMSRCGSTLLSQMLAALPNNVVISEAGMIDSVLRAKFRRSMLSDDQRADWLRWTISALGQKRSGNEKNLFIKFDSWNVLDFPVINRAFPDVPWIFMYRNPIEVLVSQFARRGAHMVPGGVEPQLFDFTHDQVFNMQPEEYCARVLARTCEAALHHHRSHPGLLVNYDQLPAVAWTGVTDFFGVDVPDTDREVFIGVSKLNAKNPGLGFESDSQTKQQRASEALRAASAKWLSPLYERLEAARLGDAAP